MTRPIAAPAQTYSMGVVATELLARLGASAVLVLVIDGPKGDESGLAGDSGTMPRIQASMEELARNLKAARASVARQREEARR